MEEPLGLSYLLGIVGGVLAAFLILFLLCIHVVRTKKCCFKGRSTYNTKEKDRYKITACGAVTIMFYTRKLNYCRMTGLFNNNNIKENNLIKLLGYLELFYAFYGHMNRNRKIFFHVLESSLLDTKLKEKFCNNINNKHFPELKEHNV
uniref:CSON006587 protein n=1 Tax=Culicoides sonorensis TaxID=179676 RepID=A0A336MUZ8_CULSO